MVMSNQANPKRKKAEGVINLNRVGSQPRRLRYKRRLKTPFTQKGKETGNSGRNHEAL